MDMPYVIVLQQKRQDVWKESAGFNVLWKSQTKLVQFSEMLKERSLRM